MTGTRPSVLHTISQGTFLTAWEGGCAVVTNTLLMEHSSSGKAGHPKAKMPVHEPARAQVGERGLEFSSLNFIQIPLTGPD